MGIKLFESDNCKGPYNHYHSPVPHLDLDHCVGSVDIHGHPWALYKHHHYHGHPVIYKAGHHRINFEILSMRPHHPGHKHERFENGFCHNSKRGKSSKLKKQKRTISRPATFSMASYFAKILRDPFRRLLPHNWAFLMGILISITFVNKFKLNHKVMDYGDIWKLKQNNYIVRDCDPTYHSGPYTFIETPTNGFFNQYLKLTAVLHLVRQFPGTIVFPQFSMTRTGVVDFFQTRWNLVDSKKFYDIEYLIKYWKERNVTMCLGSTKLNETSSWLNTTSFCKTIVPFKKRQLGIIAFPILDEYCNRADWLNLNPTTFPLAVLEYFKMKANDANYTLSSTDAVTVTPMWNMLPHFFTYLKKSDAGLAYIRDSSLSLKLAESIIKVGKLIVEKVKEKRKMLNSKFGPLVGIHARIEKDWYHRLNVMEGPRAILSQYQSKIKQLTNMPGIVYIAVGTLDTNATEMLSQWANANFGDRWILKSSMNIEDKLKVIPLEAQAAVEFVALTGIDLFLGHAFSSFDVVTCDFRNYCGRR